MQPSVDILLPTFNHERFVAKAIEGAVCQVTDFPYRLLIGEDCSTDSTRSIVLDYAKKYPEKIIPHLRKKNLGVKGKGSNGYLLYEAVTSKYVALLDGDDFWTDPNKLQKQVDFLEQNLNVSGCFHEAVTVDMEDNIIDQNYFGQGKSRYTQEEALIMGSSYATCSLVFRSSVLKPIPTWIESNICDFTLDLLITEFGELAYLPENMAAYRIQNTGVWQGSPSVKRLEESLSRYQMLYSVTSFRKKYNDYLWHQILNVFKEIIVKNRSISKKIKYFLRMLQFLNYLEPRSYLFLIRSILHVFGILR